MVYLQETLDSLCDLYSLLKEEDMLVGIWQKRAKFAETNVALGYEMHGFFEQAQQSFEMVGTFQLTDCACNAVLEVFTVFHMTETP